MPFAYRPLGERQIRLLKLRKLSSDALAYDLVHVDISTKIKYSALSYTWGEAGDAQIIQLDGEWFPTRENLHAALLAIDERRRGSQTSIVKGHIWVDAICINQGQDEEALAERSLQITMMTQIYERASTILVWLAKPQNEHFNHLAFRKIEYFYERFRDAQTKNRPYHPWWWPHKVSTPDKDVSTFLVCISGMDIEVSGGEGSGPVAHRAWLGIRALYRSPWWSRTWVIQEATVPEKLRSKVFPRGMRVPGFQSKVKFLCGSETTTREQLYPLLLVTNHIVNIGHQRSLEFFRLSPEAPSELMIFNIQRNSHFSLLSFLEILELFRKAECSDPRDKVYAPLCLAAADIRCKIKPDYRPTNAVLDVYLDVVNVVTQQPSGGMDFLGHAAWDPRPLRTFPTNWRLSEIPSWLPNWWERAGFHPIPKLLNIEMKIAGKAVVPIDLRGIKICTAVPQQVRSFNATSKSACYIAIDGANLLVRGILCGTIQDTAIPDGLRVQAPGATTLEKIPTWEPIIKTAYEGESVSEILNKVQMMDLRYDWKGNPCGRGSCIAPPPAHWREGLNAKDITAQRKLQSALSNSIAGRHVCLLENGCLGMMPLSAKVGDSIFAFLGGQVLYTLRQVVSRPGHHVYIGETYVHGLMDGEVMRWVEAKMAQVEDLVLVLLKRIN